MTRQKTTVWVAGAAAIALLVLAAGWLLVLGPQRASAADAMTQRNAVKAQNATLALQNQTLKAQFANLDTRRARLAEIRATMPDDSQLPALLRQLQASATSAGTTLTEFTSGAPTLWGSDGAVAAAPAAASKAPAVVQVPVTLSTTASFASTELYVKQLQSDSTRFFLIDSVKLSQADAGSVLATIEGKVFVFADDAARLTGTTSGASAPSATAGTAPTAAATAQPTATPTATS
ncbi:hypothetical protein [Kineococcus sp. NPDC059986]|uniref:hypothetical protein n=1 Tax=Kineococcus sp. NPDC059986 TaxID=3155538 RepID=UPI00344D39CB